MAGIDSITSSLLDRGYDALALSTADQAAMEALAAGKAIRPDQAERALEAAQVLAEQLGWDFLAALRRSDDLDSTLKPAGRP